MSTLDDIKARVAGHTEGPLVVDDEEQTVRVGYAGEIMFDRSGEGRSYWAECRPNAELIAAAPKLLAALEAVEALHKPVLENGEPVGCRVCDWGEDDYWPCATLRDLEEALA